MQCWTSSGSGKRKIRDSNGTQRDGHSVQRTLSITHQSSLPYRRQLTPPVTSSIPTIPPSPSVGRPHRLYSLSFFISLLSAPFLMALKKSRKRAAEIPRRRKTEETKEEPVEAMKKLGCGGSAKKVYSVSPYDYQLLEDIGQGSSATVFRALYIPYNEIVAVKCLDLDRSCSNLDDIRREAQTMSLIDHPNVVKGYCSFIVEHSLWVVMPFMSEGSCFHLMKAAYPDGLEEHIIGVVLKETLKALEYLHKHGNIHRDVKAGNILLDRAGAVKLSDFGITAGMFDQGDRKHSRNTFVGTPCWMAPEVMQPGGGYNFKADIWSFGITALELAHGHAPFSKYPPMKVLLMTLQNAPPGLDYDRDKKFSKSFKEMVAMCLVKDQTKRPSAEKLLKHSFFKNVKSLDIFMKSLLADLPPLWDRVKELQLKDAEKLALNRMPSSEQEALSKSEYQKGVSAWNFDIEDLKVQASLIIDDDDIVETKEGGGSLRNIINYKCEHEAATSGYTSEKSVSSDRNSVRQNFREAEVSAGGILFKKSEEPDILEDSNLDDPSRCDKVKLSTDSETSTSMHDTECRWKSQVRKKSQIYSGPLLSSNMQINSSEIGRPFESQLLNEGSRYDWKALGFSGPLIIPNRASANSLSAPTVSLRGSGDSLDNSRASVIQIKGRFSVTSENVDFVKVLPLAKSASVSDGISDPKQVVLPLAKSASVSDGISDPKQVAKVDSIEGEHLLLDEISELQARMINLNDELTAARIKHSQLQQQLSTAYARSNGVNT